MAVWHLSICTSDNRCFHCIHKTIDNLFEYYSDNNISYTSSLKNNILHITYRTVHICSQNTTLNNSTKCTTGILQCNEQLFGNRVNQPLKSSTV